MAVYKFKNPTVLTVGVRQIFDDKLAYIMVMVDKNNIVKDYAIVNINDISDIAIGKTSAEAIASYRGKTPASDASESKTAGAADMTKDGQEITGYSISSKDGQTLITLTFADGKTETFWIQ
jgi:hypothetical protein